MGNTQLSVASSLISLAVDLLLWSWAAAGAPVRLAGSTPCSGRVEIFYNNTWGTVCDDAWGLNDAKVVCRQTGCGTALDAPRSARFGQGTGQIWLDNVMCAGSEGSLTECRHAGFGKHDCRHDEDAGVLCTGVPIRLTGPTRCSGRVEVYYNNSWGTVCDDSWDLNDTEVVCRELDCGSALAFLPGARFGAGAGQIWLDEVACSGHEISLTECRHNTFGKHNCKHTEDTGVVCSEALQRPAITVSSENSRLVRGPEGTEVTRGSSFVLTCSIKLSYTPGRFRLTLEGSGSSRAETAVNDSASFDFPVAEHEHQGNYSCVYEISGFSKNFTSTEAEPISIIVKEPLWLTISLVVAGVLAPLLLVSLGVCAVCRRRRVKRPAARGPTQMSVARGCDVSEEEDDEGSYVNVEVANARMQTEEEEDAHSYEDPVSQDNYNGAVEFGYMSAHGSEESSDDQNDYENVTADRHTMDIHETQEDIYQNYQSQY